jgi:hypothetical protein
LFFSSSAFTLMIAEFSELVYVWICLRERGGLRSWLEMRPSMPVSFLKILLLFYLLLTWL